MQDRQHRIAKALQRAVQAGQVPLALGAVTDAAGRITWAGAGATPTAPRMATPDLDSVFNVASMAKPITTAAALALAQDGRLSLDHPLERLEPAAARLRVLAGWDTAGAPLFRPPARPITLLDLLTHSAGLAHPVWNPVAQRLARHALPGGPAADPRTDPWSAPLLADPGERWDYSSTALDLVGALVARASGQGLDGFLRQRIFAPLGMKDTGWDLTLSMRARRIPVVQRGPDGGFQPDPTPPPTAPARVYGAGGLYSTARDYLAFLRLMLDAPAGQTPSVLPPQALAAMTGFRLRHPAVGRLQSADPALARDVEFFPGRPKSWSLGFLVNDLAVPGGRSADSLSWFGALNTHFWVDRQAGLAAVFLTQLRLCGDAGAMAALAGFEQAVYADPSGGWA